MTIYALGPFHLDTQDDLLLRGAEPTALGGRAIALLRILVERPGAVVSKADLIEAAWRDRAVEESNLTVQIAALRRVLGEEHGGDRWIETLPRRGYRYVGPVVTTAEAPRAEPPRVDAAPAPSPTPVGERRQVTVMACELAGVAAGADGIGLEEAREAISAFRQCVLEAAGRHGAFPASRLGKSAVFLFGYPAAHEHDAEQAVRAGLELCAAVATLRPGAKPPMRCRVGIATGMVILGDGAGAAGVWEDGIVGDAPSLAERLRLSAPTDTVAIDPATRHLIGELFDCRDLGAIDGAGSIGRWQVLGESSVASRFEALHPAALTPLVGREEEIELLRRRWRQAKSGNGQVVLLCGEPGIGKSRIATTLLRELRPEPHILLRYFCSPDHTESALHPTISQLRRAARVEREDSPAANFGKLAALLRQHRATCAEIGLLAELLSLPQPEADAAALPLTPQQKKERTFAALLRQLEALARDTPVFILFEDAHWADPSSGELLDHIVERVPHLRVLLAITFRPEHRPPWVGLPNTALLTLARLGERDAARLARHVAGDRALPADIVDQIVKRADGIPLFIEELTKTQLETSLLRKQSKDHGQALPLQPPAVPMSLHDLLMSRLDRLASARRVAQIGAAIGRQFSYALVQLVSGLPDDELRASLARLVASELVRQRGAAPDAVYTFKHALVQDAAYGSLLRETRQQLHAQIADALETHSPELIDSQPELLAQHYAQAGLVAKSVAYWERAGRRSAARSAMAEAAAQLQKGLAQLALSPDNAARQRQELEFLSALGAVLNAVKGAAAPDTGRAYARAHQLWERLGSPAELLQVPYGQSRCHVFRGELDWALRLDEDLLRASRWRNDPGGLVLGHLASGRTLMFAGRLAASRSHLEAALALCDADSDGSLAHLIGIYPSLTSQAFLGIVLFSLGHPDQARAQSNAAIAEARRLAHLPSLAGVLAAAGRVLALVGDHGASAERAAQLLAVTAEQNYPFYRAQGTIFLGWAQVKNGDAAEGIALLRNGSASFRATGAEVWTPHHLAFLAAAYESEGQVEKALTLVDQALQIVERTGERWFAAELNRSKGQLLLRRGDPEAAEELYRRARDIAVAQGAKLWELRVAVSLARLRRSQGCGAEARDLLAPVYGWFTEGFDAPDLKEAKALLDALR